ncbi:uncharacterized protein TNCV_219031 [Trichonephila clavipes]|nr:uncharacterized protein TNCV_219031 [Trichonephila clavipes]
MSSHCGFRGNEMENLLAERGKNIIQISARDLPLLLANLELNRIYKKCFRDVAISDATNKSWRVLLKPNCVSDSPRATAVAELRLLTEYGSLCAHLYCFNLTDSLFCVLLDNSLALLI